MLDQAITNQDIVYGQTSRQLPNGQGCILDAGTFVITRPRRRSNYSLVPCPGLLLTEAVAIIADTMRNSIYQTSCLDLRSTQCMCAGAQVQQFMGRPEDQNLGLALSAMQAQSGMVPFLSGRIANGAVVIDTWAEDVTDVTNGAAAVACLGIVPYEASGSKPEQTDPQEVYAAAFVQHADVCLQRPVGLAALTVTTRETCWDLH